MLLYDRIGITNKRKLPDGRLVVDARFARAGIYHYTGSEVGRADMATVRVYRPPEEVFDADSMGSFAFKAVTDDHPPVLVDASNWTRYSRGISDGEVKRDGEFVRIPMMLADAALVADVEAGKKELSAGYEAELTFEVGITGAGEHYDAVMRNIRGNHIAVVDKGRAGAECSIADRASEGTETMPEPVATKLMTFDSIPILVTDAAEAAIVKLQGIVRDAGSALEKAIADHAAVIAAKDAELGTKDAEIADLKGKALTDEALDARVSERAALLTDVALVAPKLDTKGKSVADIRRAAVTDALPEAERSTLKDKSDEYVSFYFDALVKRAKTAANDGGNGSGQRDPLTDALGDTLPGGGGGGNGAPRSGEAAYKKMKDGLVNAWENPDKREAA